MKPIFHYSGNKSKEAKYIKSLMPPQTQRIVEPFGGSAALSFALEKPAIIGDVRENNIITLQQFKQHGEELLLFFTELQQKSTEELQELYYYWRDEMYGNNDPLIMAKRWIIVKNNCYAGLDRVNNKTGKYNISFGFRDKMPWNGTQQHIELLKDWQIVLQDWKDTANLAKQNDFVFFDPPYYNRTSDYGGTYKNEEQIHIDIRDWMQNSPIPSMIVHIDCELYQDLYSKMNIETKDYTYVTKTNNSKVQHLYITNYQTKTSLF